MNIIDADFPRFKHDCSFCTFLGPFGSHDLYHCPRHGSPTLVARHSSEGSDYSSFPACIVRENRDMLGSSPLFEAYRRAFLRRLPLG
jgi:hypothetical protein